MGREREREKARTMKSAFADENGSAGKGPNSVTSEVRPCFLAADQVYRSLQQLPLFQSTFYLRYTPAKRLIQAPPVLCHPAQLLTNRRASRILHRDVRFKICIGQQKQHCYTSHQPFSRHLELSCMFPILANTTDDGDDEGVR